MVLINSKYKYLHEYLLNIPKFFESMGDVIYTGRNLIKVMTAPCGLRINVKRFHVPMGINKFVYSFGIRKPKGLRAYKYPQILLDKGIETPEPIAYIEERHFGLLGYSYFVSVQCDYEHTMYEIGNAKPGSYEQLAIALADYTANMHNNGIMHLDYSPGNILWKKTYDSYSFSIVDTNRMYFGKVDMGKGCANFKRLWGPKSFFILLIQEYAKIRGFNIQKSEKLALKYRSVFWKRFGKKHLIKFKLEI